MPCRSCELRVARRPLGLGIGIRVAIGSTLRQEVQGQGVPGTFNQGVRIAFNAARAAAYLELTTEGEPAYFSALMIPEPSLIVITWLASTRLKLSTF
jgi:hypothetical protein